MKIGGYQWRKLINRVILLISMSHVALALDLTSYPKFVNAALTSDVSYICNKAKGIIPDAYPAADFSAATAKLRQCHNTWDQSVPQDILDFNNRISQQSTTGLNQLYLYGANLIMTNDGARASIDTSADNVITTADGKVVYSGVNNIDNYLAKIQLNNLQGSNKVTYITAVISGSDLALGQFGQYLNQHQNKLGTYTGKNFNDLSATEAMTAAKQILITGVSSGKSAGSEGICLNLAKLSAANPHINIKGLLFKLGRFTLPANTSAASECSSATPPSTGCGSYNFYQAVKTIFSDTKDYPQCSGDYFSVSTTPDALLLPNHIIKTDAQKLFGVPVPGAPSVDYVVLAMGDLSGLNLPVQLASHMPAWMTTADLNMARAGFVTSTMEYYANNIQKEFLNNLANIDKAGIHYQLTIPAAATQHEFDAFMIQVPNADDVDFAKQDPLVPGFYHPSAADNDTEFSDIAAYPITDHTQAIKVSGELDSIRNYVLGRDAYYPTHFMGIVLDAFHPPHGNGWAPRNIYGGGGMQSEYHMLDQITDPTTRQVIPYSGYVNPDVYQRLYIPNTICMMPKGTKGCGAAADYYSDENYMYYSLLREGIKKDSLFNFNGALPTDQDISWSDSSYAIAAPYGVSVDSMIHGATLDASATLTNPQSSDVITYSCSIHTPAPAHTAVANTKCIIPSTGAVRPITIAGAGLNPANGYAIYVSATVTRDGATVPDAQVHWIRLYKEIPAATASESINWPTADADISIPSTYSGTSLTGTLTANAILLKPQDGDQLVYSCGVYDRSMKPVAGALCEVDASNSTQHKVDVSKIPSTATDLTIYFSATVSRDGKTVPSAKIPWIKVDKDTQRSS